MSDPAESPPVYRERLWVAWWGWPLPLAAAALISAEIHLGYPGVRSWLPYVVLVPLAAVLVHMAGRAAVTVTDDELHVGAAHLPLRFVGDVDTIPRESKRKALGPHLDPAAYVLHRGWVGPLVRVHLSDPDDPTPYWLFSTRDPDRLAEVLRSASLKHSRGR